MRTYTTYIFSVLLSTCLFMGQSFGRNLVVVTTTTMITDLVKQVGEPDIQILSLMGTGTDPHLYKPTARDIQKMRIADVIFYNGLHLEGRMEDVLRNMQKRNPGVKALGDYIPSSLLLYADAERKHPDPHLWFDVSLWSSCVDTVAQTLADKDPNHAAAFLERGAKLKARYEALHQWAQDRVAKVPADKRILVTSHDAYSYFGRAYGFQVKGVQGISTMTEAGLADVTRMVDFVKKHAIKAIFVESSVSPAVIERISKDAGAKIGGELYSDSLGSAKENFIDPITQEAYALDTYEGVVRYNIETIAQSLE